MQKLKKILPTPPKPPKFGGSGEHRAPAPVNLNEPVEYATLEWAHAQVKKEEVRPAMVKPSRKKPPISLPRLPFTKYSDDDEDDDDDDDEFKDEEVVYAEVVKGPGITLGGYSFGGGGGGASSKAAEVEDDEEELSGEGAYCSGNQMMRVLYDYDSKVSDENSSLFC